MSNSAPRSLVAPLDRAKADEIDDPDEVALDADRQLQHHRLGAQPIIDHRDAAREIGADAIHLVDKADPRDAVFVGLPPDGLRLGLDAGDRVEYRDGPVEHPQAALDLDREIDVARRVDDVDAMVLPKAGGRGRGDRNAALLLLRHPIHRRGAFVHLAHLIGAAGVIEDALGGGCLTGIDMRHDADVSVSLERCRACHESNSAGATRARAPSRKMVSRSWSASSLTSGSARRPCSHQPCDAYPPAASPRHRDCWRHRAAPPKAAPPSCSPSARANSK